MENLNVFRTNNLVDFVLQSALQSVEFSVYACLVHPVWNLPFSSFIDIAHTTLHFPLLFLV